MTSIKERLERILIKEYFPTSIIRIKIKYQNFYFQVSGKSNKVLLGYSENELEDYTKMKKEGKNFPHISQSMMLSMINSWDEGSINLAEIKFRDTWWNLK